MESPSATCLAETTEALHVDFMSSDCTKLFPDSEQKLNFSWTPSAKKPPSCLANKVVEVYRKLLKLYASVPNKVALFSLVLDTSLLC